LSQPSEIDPIQNQIPGIDQRIRPGRPDRPFPGKDLPNKKQLIPENQLPNRQR
jgi:hypothetical protein